MAGDIIENIEPNKLAGNGLERNPDGTVKSGVLNPNGRPKRKTITELIHAKLDDTPEGWDKLIALVMYKLFNEKDKDLLKTLWQYTDGMPVQKNILGGDEDNPIKIDVNSALKKIYGSTGTSSAGEMPDDS